MIEVKFRAKLKYEDKFVYGVPVQDVDGDWYMLELPCEGYIEVSILGEIEPGTISQFTGFKDKKGKEIYEGDIVNVSFDDDSFVKGVIFWDKERGCWNIRDRVGDDYYDYYTGSTPFEAIKEIEVIGNIMNQKNKQKT